MSEGKKKGNTKGSTDRKSVLLRLDLSVHDALTKWANDDFRSLNSQVELLLREALKRSGRFPKEAKPVPKRGRPVGS